jgi:hypothetical protein
MRAGSLVRDFGDAGHFAKRGQCGMDIFLQINVNLNFATHVSPRTKQEYSVSIIISCYIVWTSERESSRESGKIGKR